MHGLKGLTAGRKAHRRRGLDVHHAWLLEDLPGGRLRILTQETQIGKPAQELARTKPNPMLNTHQEWIEGLARAGLSGRSPHAAGLFGRGAIGSLGDHRSLCEPSHGAKLHVLDKGLLPDGDERIAREWERISLRKVKCCISHTVPVRGGLTCARLPTTM